MIGYAAKDLFGHFFKYAFKPKHLIHLEKAAKRADMAIPRKIIGPNIIKKPVERALETSLDVSSSREIEDISDT